MIFFSLFTSWYKDYFSYFSKNINFPAVSRLKMTLFLNFLIIHQLCTLFWLLIWQNEPLLCFWLNMKSTFFLGWLKVGAPQRPWEPFRRFPVNVWFLWTRRRSEPVERLYLQLLYSAQNIGKNERPECMQYVNSLFFIFLLKYKKKKKNIIISSTIIMHRPQLKNKIK